MTYPDLPDGYYLAEQEGESPGVVERATLCGESHWRHANDYRGPDPRTLGYVLTPVSAMTDMKDDLAAMTARAEKAEESLMHYHNLARWSNPTKDPQ